MTHVEFRNAAGRNAANATGRSSLLRLFTAIAVAVQLAGSGAALAQATSGGGAAGGGSLGSSAASPGTNSAGTAAPSGGSATGASVATGTGDPMTDKQDKQVDKKIKSICKGC